MTVAVVLPLVAAVVLRVAGPTAARRGGPATGARLLPLIALVVAATSLVSVGAAAGLLLAGNPALARVGRWSIAPIPWHQVDFGWVVGAVGVLLAGAAVTATAVHAASLLRELAAAGRLHRVPGADLVGDLVTVDDTHPRAFAVGRMPGRPGTVVVTTGMLAALTEPEQEAVLAHERAHLRRRHHLSLIAAELAARANPLLAPVARATAAAVEREADEDAARSIGDRSTVARALARMGLAVAESQRRPAGDRALPAASSTPVSQRIDALVVPPVRGNRVVVALLLLLAGTAATAALSTTLRTEDSFEGARDDYSAAGSTPISATDPTGCPRHPWVRRTPPGQGDGPGRHPACSGSVAGSEQARREGTDG